MCPLFTKRVNMQKIRVLYVTQEITPFLPESEIATTARNLSQGMNEIGKEIRAFMPRFGCINERRHQLHEVIRLSGLNLSINDSDHPLIIKVASVPAARMQVYFIDNEEFFKRKSMTNDDNGKFFNDNDERAIFFCRGVLETVKKLGWVPHVIHCHGWMSAFMPLFVKHMYNDDPHFNEAKVVYTPYGNGFEQNLDAGLRGKLTMEGIKDHCVECIDSPSFENLTKLAIQHSDAISYSTHAISKSLSEFISSSTKPKLEWNEPENLIKEHAEFYEGLVEEHQLVG